MSSLLDIATEEQRGAEPMSELPDFPVNLISDWLELKRAAAKFKDTLRAHQLLCPHSHAVQYNPRYNTFKKPECQSKPTRVCISCGIVETAEKALDPDSFSELDATNGAEIVAIFEQGYRFNHYRLPWSVELDREGGNGTRFEIACEEVSDNAIWRVET